MGIGENWKKELDQILERRARASRAEQERKQFEDFIQGIAIPALTEIAAALNERGREASVRNGDNSCLLMVKMMPPAVPGFPQPAAPLEEISFRVLKRSVPNAIVPYAEVRLRKGLRLVKMESNIRESEPGTNAPLLGTTKEDVIACFLRHYSQVLDSEQ